MAAKTQSATDACEHEYGTTGATVYCIRCPMEWDIPELVHDCDEARRKLAKAVDCFQQLHTDIQVNSPTRRAMLMFIDGALSEITSMAENASELDDLKAALLPFANCSGLQPMDLSEPRRWCGKCAGCKARIVLDGKLPT